MSCTGNYATANDFSVKFCDAVPIEDEAEINRNLELAAANIHAARAAQGACNCTLAEWAEVYLKDLNCIIAAAFFNCNCYRLSAEDKSVFVEWANTQLDHIRAGRLELCDGQTGVEYPAVGWAEYSFTDRNTAQLISNAQARSGS